MPRVDRDQLAALRRLQAAFGTVRVLAVHNQVEGAPAGPSLASQQLALTIWTRPAPPCRRHDPEIGWARLPDPPSTERGS
jgi:hypothetical protein